GLRYCTSGRRSARRMRGKCCACSAFAAGTGPAADPQPALARAAQRVAHRVIVPPKPAGSTQPAGHRGGIIMPNISSTTTDPRTGDTVESNRGVDRDATHADDHVERDVVPARTTDVDLQERRFGGFKFGAAFFGWLSAMGLAVILVALLAAGGAALPLGYNAPRATGVDNAAPITIGAGVALVVLLCIAYFAGGYVAGRMARFSGAGNGFGVWIIGVVATAALAAAGALFGSEYHVLGRLDLAHIPIDEGSLTTGGAITLAAAALGTLVAALLGGKAGEAY